MEEEKPAAFDEKTIQEDLSRMEKEESVVVFNKDFKVEEFSGAQVWECKALILNTKLTQCEALIQERFNSSPWAMSLYCEIGLMRFAFGRQDKDWEAAILRYKSASAQAEVLAKRHKCKPKKSNVQTALLYLEAVAFQANALLGVGLLHFMKRNILKAAYYVRKSWKHWENAEELLKSLEGLKADVPSRLKGYVLGFTGDRSRAVELLHVAQDIAECGRSAEATFVVYFLYMWFMDEQAKAPALMEGLQQKLPDSPLICLASGWTALINDKDTSKAIERYEYAEAHTEIEFLKIACRSQKAYAHFLREDWKDVISLLCQYLDKYPQAESRSYNAYSIAIASHMTDQSEECTKWMKKSIEWEDKNSNWDNYAMTVAKAYVANGNTFDRCTLLFLLAENSNEAGNAERALKYLEEVESTPEWKGFSGDDKLAMLCYYRGCALKLQKEFEKAKSMFIKAAGMHGKNLSFEARRAVPYSLVVIGELYLRDLDSLDNAERFFAKAKQFKDKYLFAEMLGYRIKANEEICAHKRRKLKMAEK